MTLVQFLLGTYLVVGLLATVVILAVLRVSKRRGDRAGNPGQDKVKPSPFREHKTKPSRSN